MVGVVGGGVESGGASIEGVELVKGGEREMGKNIVLVVGLFLYSLLFLEFFYFHYNTIN